MWTRTTNQSLRMRLLFHLSYADKIVLRMAGLEPAHVQIFRPNCSTIRLHSQIKSAPTKLSETSKPCSSTRIRCEKLVRHFRRSSGLLTRARFWCGQFVDIHFDSVIDKRVLDYFGHNVPVATSKTASNLGHVDARKSKLPYA